MCLLYFFFRFIKADLSDLNKEMEVKIAKAASDLVTLDKSKKYLERNINESQNGLREIVGRPWEKVIFFL